MSPRCTLHPNRKARFEGGRCILCFREAAIEAEVVALMELPPIKSALDLVRRLEGRK